MQRINAKYLMWKTVIHLLLMIMVLAPTLVAALIMNTGVAPALTSKILSCASFFLFLVLQRWLMSRSNLSRISRARYILGESIAYALLTLLGCVLLLALSKGASPLDFSYILLFFFPVLPLSFLTGNILLGFLLQCALYPPLVALLYVLKKKKDPSLGGRAKTNSEGREPVRIEGEWIDEASDQGASSDGAGDVSGSEAEHD